MTDNFVKELDRLRDRIEPLARLLHSLTFKLDRPSLVRRGRHRGYRYSQPSLHHFCLLRGARVVSALNASIELANAGYSQEVQTLLRTMVEYTTQIDFMLASIDKDGALSADAAEFISSYFEDDSRDNPTTGRRTKLAQKSVHEKIGARLDSFSDDKTKSPAEKLLSSVYMRFSNYVHARYPESMDMYGGMPGRFHVTGMRHTPKDVENLAVLDTMITTASNCFIGMVQDLPLYSLIASDEVLDRWYRKGTGE